MRSPLADLALLALALLAPLTGCARPLDSETTTVPPATGDQAVFSDIAVKIETTEFDHVDPNASAATVYPQPILVGLEIRVTVNGGTRERRVPGLQVFVDGKGVEESGSAGLPEQFSYLHYRKDPVLRAQRSIVELRYRGASYFAQVAPFAAEITAPVANQPVPADQTLIVRWTGGQDDPSLRTEATYYETNGTGPCAVSFKQVSVTSTEAVFAPVPSSGPHAPSCTGELHLRWWSDGTEPASPFHAFRLATGLLRVHRFAIR